MNTTIAHAINGPQFIGFSAESTALAGSDHVAVADTSAINTSPAALSLIQGTRIDVTAGVLKAFLHQSDVFGNNNVAGQNNVYAPGNLELSYAVFQEPSWKDKDRLVLRAGYNYSNNPIPKETLSPLWPLINAPLYREIRIWFYREVGLRLRWHICSEEQRNIHQSLAAFRAKRDRIDKRLLYYNTVSYRF